MSFLDWPLEDYQFARHGHAKRRNIACRLIELFGLAFPQISYTLIWDSRLVNAQAWRLGEARNVYLYGGLVRHPSIRKAGLALALAHETGHHLGGLPRDPAMQWMTSQGQADYWAARFGMPAVFGADAARRITARGAREIVALQVRLRAASDQIDDLAPEMRLAILEAGRCGEAFPPGVTLR